MFRPVIRIPGRVAHMSRECSRALVRRHSNRTVSKLLICNRGEIAVRIARTAADMDISTVSVASSDDARSLHTRKTDACVQLRGVGAAAYLDGAQMIRIAKETGCDAIHPGYGFLSESASFARACADSGIAFIGPTTDQLALFGDKASTRQLAAACGVPIISGTSGPATLADAAEFYRTLPPGAQLLVKACAGGGGRGMRVVPSIEALPDMFDHCKREALACFGDDGVYVERLISRARHVEVQVVGDGYSVNHLFERECSVQRRHQKVIEIAPAPGLSGGMLAKLFDASLKMASRAGYVGLGTFEFLIDLDSPGMYYFIETNPRLQVEHTVTEAVTGLDLVEIQLRVARGETLHQLALDRNSRLDSTPRGYAIQARVNMESLVKQPDTGRFHLVPSGGDISVFEPPSGLGIRVDAFAYAGYSTTSNFDSLLGKLIVHSDSPAFGLTVKKCIRALREFRIEGVETNIPFLLRILSTSEFVLFQWYTRQVDDMLAAAGSAFQEQLAPPLYFKTADDSDPSYQSSDRGNVENASEFDYCMGVSAPMHSSVLEISVAEGDAVRRGQQLSILSAMKMEHIISTPVNGVVKHVCCRVGGTVSSGGVLFYIDPADNITTAVEEEVSIDLNQIRPDLKESIARHELGFDAARPECVQKRHKSGRRTARENISELYDPGTFVEYGGLAIAAQKQRRKVEDLIKNTPADGMVTGIGSVNGDLFPGQTTQCMLMSYDYMVLAGTQGLQNHRKKDRMFEIAERLRLPIILLAEGGGGRPGDTDTSSIAGLDCMAFSLYAKLNGLVPRIGIASGRCFAGNAALLGASDVVIATKDANIGMGGPAMIEGGGLGIYKPEEIGPISVQGYNGVVDIVVENEKDAMLAAKKYLSYFQGALSDWSQHDQRQLRHVVPENRLRVYDMRELIRTLADVDSVLEIRHKFGGVITAFVRIEGRPVGVIANDPAKLSGALDSDSADKAARFMQLCDSFDIPILSLCDTPGIMVGPEVEKTGLVRHAARLFLNAANLSVPLLTIVTRKGYGLGAMAMAGGSFKSSLFTVAWPTGEFGGMGLEGAVKLGYRKELESILDPDERKRAYDERIMSLYEHGKAVNYATAFEIDDVIDPMSSRVWITSLLKSVPSKGLMENRNRRRFVDAW